MLAGGADYYGLKCYDGHCTVAHKLTLILLSVQVEMLPDQCDWLLHIALLHTS